MVKGTIVVTGAAGGIGSGWVVENLKTEQAKFYHTIYFIHPSAPGHLKEILTQHAPSEHSYEILPLDLSKMSAVRLAATELKTRIEKGEVGKIKILLLIAGAMFLDPRTKDGVSFTEEGIECSFAVNYFCNFLLVLLLLQSLDRKSGARIIAMGSTNHNPYLLSTRGTFHTKESKVLFGEQGTKDLVKATERVGRGDVFPASVRRYGRSKWCLITFFYELQRRVEKDPETQNISCLLQDPGAVGGTTLLAQMPFWIRWVLMYVMVPVQAVWVLLFRNGRFRTTRQVGRDLIWSCWDEKSLGKTPRGLYLNGTEVSSSSKETYDESKQGRLWKESLELVGLTEKVIGLNDGK